MLTSESVSLFRSIVSKFHFHENSSSLRAGSLIQVQGKYMAAEPSSREKNGSAAKIIFPRNSRKWACSKARTAVTSIALKYADMTIQDTINLMITLVFDVSWQIYNTQYCKIKKSQKRRINKKNLIDMTTLSYLLLCVCKQITSQCVGFTPTCLKLCFVDSNFLQTIIISQTASLSCFLDVLTAKLTCANKFLIGLRKIKHRHLLPTTYLICKKFFRAKITPLFTVVAYLAT